MAAASNLTQMVHDGVAPVAPQVNLRPIEEMLRSLATKIDEAGRPGAEADAFDSLEQQISGLATRLDAAVATRSAETGIERTLQDLVVHLKSLRQETTEAASRAAREAVAAVGERPDGRASELSELLSGLRETHLSSGRETQDAIGAVHQTLETIISRLGSIEAELAQERPAPVTAPLPPRARTSQAAMAMPVAAPLAAAAADRIVPERQEPRQPELPAASALDLPLEPGSGRPRPGAGAEMSATAPGTDPQSIRQNLIAAARRSAKAASEAAAPAAAAPEPQAKGRSRIKDAIEKRRRPILLGLAAIVLAMGTAHVVKGVLDEETPTAEQAEQAAAPSAAPMQAAAEPEAPSASKDQSALAAAPAAAEPAASAAAPQPAAVEPAPPALPSFALNGPTPGTAPDTVKAATNVGELPANLGSASLRKQAQAGDARAVYQLATLAADGPAASRDAKLALRLFERAAVAGLAPAQFRVGNMFEKGVGTARDPGLARVWYARAAERGNAKAMHNLAVLHAEGVSGKPDYALATEWFKKAADVGVRDSQYNLAILLGRGLGTPADLGQSYVWFAIAANQGDEDAGRKRDEVAQRLNASDLAAAKAKVEGWKPKLLDPEANEVAVPAVNSAETPPPGRKPVKPVRG